MQLADVDLLDLDGFQRIEHHEMFTVLRAEDPVHWHDEPDGPGFWSITKHADLVAVNRDADGVLAPRPGGTSIDPTLDDGVRHARRDDARTWTRRSTPATGCSSTRASRPA